MATRWYEVQPLNTNCFCGSDCETGWDMAAWDFKPFKSLQAAEEAARKCQRCRGLRPDGSQYGGHVVVLRKSFIRTVRKIL